MSEQNALRREAWIEAAVREFSNGQVDPEIYEIIERHWDTYLASCPVADPQEKAIRELVWVAVALADWCSLHASDRLAHHDGRKLVLDVRNALARLESPPGLSAPTGAGTAAS